MKKRVIWLVVSCLTVLSLLLAACAPAKVEEKKPPTEVAPKVEVPKVGEAAPEKAAPVVETPKYGGVLNVGLQTDVVGFDQIYYGTGWDISQSISYDELFVGDWARGAAGTGEADFSNGGNFAPEGFLRETGAIAESWEIPDNQTLIFKIRKGIYFHNKPPVNGRELDANDVVYSIKRMYHNPLVPETYNVITSPGGKKLLSAVAPDKWTVVVKVEDNAVIFLEDVTERVWIVAHESVEKYGDLKDWRNSLGTGAFMLTDYIVGSSMTFVRHPNYWMKDPVGAGKGNQLPYLDGVKALIIPDKSTMLAAIRTGKIDIDSGTSSGVLLWEDVESLIKTNPAIKYKEIPPNSNQGLGIRSTSTSPLAAPLMKQRVRYALQMAIDREAILRDYYQGHGVNWVFSFFPNSPYYTPLEKYPEHIRKLFQYNPEEAKKLLAEEGYPNGFKTSIILQNIDVDLMSIVKAYWAKIGVDLEMDVRESAVYRAISGNHNFPAMVPGGGSWVGLAEKWTMFGPGDPTRPPNQSNRAEISHPKLDDFIRRSNAAYGDIDTRSKILQEAELWLVEQAWWISVPAPYSYNAWQPWVKNYHGEGEVGVRNGRNFVIWAWLDQELKKKMGR